MGDYIKHWSLEIEYDKMCSLFRTIFRISISHHHATSYQSVLLSSHLSSVLPHHSPSRCARAHKYFSSTRAEIFFRKQSIITKAVNTTLAPVGPFQTDDTRRRLAGRLARSRLLACPQTNQCREPRASLPTALFKSGEPVLRLCGTLCGWLHFPLWKSSP